MPVGLACLSGRVPVLADWLPARAARPGLHPTAWLPGLLGPGCPPWAVCLPASPGLLAACPAQAPPWGLIIFSTQNNYFFHSYEPGS